MKINSAVSFFINLGRAQSILSHRFDRGLNGLSFSEFLILFYLAQAESKKMRRVDLAEKIGITASGITRLLLPMEKIHLVKNGLPEKDARVRFVHLAPGGKQKLEEANERMEIFATQIIPANEKKELDRISNLLIQISGKALMV